MIDHKNVGRVDKVVERAIAEGAEVVVRGGPVTEGPLSEGAFFRPAILEVSDPTLPAVQEETFGPVNAWEWPYLFNLNYLDGTSRPKTACSCIARIRGRSMASRYIQPSARGYSWLELMSN